MALDRIEKGMLARFLVLLVDEIGKGYKPREKKEMQEHIYKTGMGMIDGIFSFETDKLPKGN